MKKRDKIIFGALFCSSLLNAQLGIGTPTPQETFHVNGTLQVTNSIYVGGTGNTKGSSGLPGQVLKSNGTSLPPSWEELAGVPNSTGTVIVVDGEFLVAQEITVQMSADFSGPGIEGQTVPLFIGNLDNVIIDNSNTYEGNGVENSFKVEVDGIYQINMNVQLATSSGTVPAVGVWNDTTGIWVARVNDYFDAPIEKFQTATLITSVHMQASNTYSFRIGNKAPFTVKHLSGGDTGSAPVTQVSVKRLR